MKPTYEELERQLEGSRREFRAADATIHNLELKLTDMAVQLANAESKCRELAAEENNLIDSECHVAELEESLRDKQALLEAADKLQDSAFRHGLQHGFSYGQTNDQAGYEQCLKSYSSRGKDNG